MNNEKLLLVKKIKEENFWDEYPDYPLEDWKYEVANNDTRLGYWEWIEAKE